MDPIPEEEEVCEALGSPALHSFSTVFAQSGACDSVRLFVCDNTVQWHEGLFDPFFERVDVEKISVCQSLKHYLNDVFGWVGTHSATRIDP